MARATSDLNKNATCGTRKRFLLQLLKIILYCCSIYITTAHSKNSAAGSWTSPCSPCSSGSTKGNNINKFDIDIHNLDVEISWDDLIVGERIGQGKVTDFSNADVAVDQYHLYEGDIKLMKDMGMDACRFSISWPRIFPNGTGQLNQAGVDHYNAVINSLLAIMGLNHMPTLYHWDLPQALADRYNGWLDTRIINDFAAYAETCFENFGDRVKNWMTFNEPHTFTVQGYDVGLQAPGRCSILLHLFCRTGNSATEPYIVGHNALLAHAAAFDIYKRKYKAKQHGRIGVAFDVIWFLDPIMFGDYPSSMRTRVGDRLPRFSKVQSNLLKGSLDFVGINHYTTCMERRESHWRSGINLILPKI
ncbi:beta-glucosidase 34 [Artemisia annua]|uniref:Beta-glucosidase 34 n=1 Tax=Artemisia annua TaxID=35608 RepID=A0A2U1LGX1_ARTAN|nr:beta-glucosidase 34 [Artemisia annua]